MTIRISIPYIVTFLLLLIVMMECHELVHITVGKIICGCWGSRDFNVWSLCEECANPSWGWMATISGPIFSFAVMWVGMLWLSSANAFRQSLGLSFIFANIPFGRITTVMMGGGDEMVVLKYFFSDLLSRSQIIILGSALLLLLGLPPMIKAYRTIKNKHAWAYVIGFATLPLVFLLSYLLSAMNTLLLSGVLSEAWIMGTPLLITLHTGVAVVLLIIFRKSLTLQR